MNDMRCETCGQAFTSWWVLRNHTNYHTNPRYQARVDTAAPTDAMRERQYIKDLQPDMRVTLSGPLMVTLNNMKRTNPEWLERYG